MRKITVIVALIIAFFILFVPGYILWLTWRPPEPIPAMITPNTTNTSRFLASDPADLSNEIANALFPEAGNNAPGGTIRVPADNWQAGVAAAPLIRWVNGPLIMDEGSTVRVESSIQNAPGEFAESDSAALAASVDATTATISGSLTTNVLLVSEDPGFAIPAAYWAAQSGDAVLFASDELPEATREALSRRNGEARIYTLGVDGAALGLDEFGTYKNLSANNNITAALEMAEFYDEDNDFGWGFELNNFGWRVNAHYNFVLANQELPEMAIAGVSLGRFGKFGPLLWTDRDRIPTLVNQYLWKAKTEYYTNPVEGPFNHAWILGDYDIIDSVVQGRTNTSQEISEYRSQGDYGLSGLEMLLVVWIVAGIVSAIWLVLYSWRRLPQISTMMLVTWGLLGLVFGPVGVWIYSMSYDQAPWRKDGMMASWQRPSFNAVMAASAMNRGFDGPLMLVISWIVTFLGLPLVVFQGPWFWLGNSMMWGIYISYFGALLLHWLVMHAGMFMMGSDRSYGQAVKRAFLPAFVSMTAMAVGMMGFMWWIQMVNLGSMPDDDELLWWGTTVLSIAVGWLVALPFDALLVKHDIQPGDM